MTLLVTLREDDGSIVEHAVYSCCYLPLMEEGRPCVGIQLIDAQHRARIVAPARIVKVAAREEAKP